MITIDEAAWAAMIEHLQQAAPHEGVGLLAGLEGLPRGVDPPVMVAPNGRNVHAGYGVVDRWVPLDNVSDWPRLRYEVDPARLVGAWQALEDDGRRPWIVVHSHVNHTATPSQLDIRYATDPTLLHLIVSMTGGAYPVGALWRLDPNGRTPEEQVQRVGYRVSDLGFQSKGTTDLTRDVSSRSV